jgi:hypothetical protein
MLIPSSWYPATWHNIPEDSKLHKLFMCYHEVYRLADHLEGSSTFLLKKIKCIVLDEADR